MFEQRCLSVLKELIVIVKFSLKAKVTINWPVLKTNSVVYVSQAFSLINKISIGFALLDIIRTILPQRLSKNSQLIAHKKKN